MQEPTKEGSARFDTRAGLETHLRACLAAAHVTLDLFDPDFAVFALGSIETDTLLRAFLGRGGMLRLAMHSPAHIERHYPRLLRHAEGTAQSDRFLLHRRQPACAPAFS